MCLRGLAFGACLALLGPLAAGAGEIVILQPGGDATGVERAATRSATEARHYQNGTEAPLLIEEGTVVRNEAERASDDAQYYLRESSEGEPFAGDGTTIILRAVPPGEAERLRQRARALVAPPAQPNRVRQCTEVANSVGMVGEGAGAQRSNSVIESGGSAVNLNCK